MKNAIRLSLLYLLLTVFWGNTHAFIKLEGYIPQHIQSEQMKQQYIRIWQTLVPDLQIDTSSLYVTYYHHQRGKRYGVRLPEWGGGGAIGTDSIIVPINRTPVLGMDFYQITVHELVHIVVNRAFGTTHIPRWLHEGLAMVLSGEMPLEGQKRLSWAVLSGDLLSLDTIEHVNRFDASRAHLAYAMSHAVVLFMIETYAIDGIEELLRAARGRHSFPAALKEVYGFTPQEFEVEAVKFIYSRYRFSFLSDQSYIWILTGLLALAAIIVSQLRTRRRLREMVLQESALEPSQQQEND